MPRFDRYEAFDDTPNITGDRGFIGVNMRLDPAQLLPGFVSFAVNCRFRNGVVEPRKGIVLLPWMNKIVANSVRPWSSIFGVGVFSDPFTLQDYLLIAAEGSVYWCAQGNKAVALSLPSGVTITTNVTFTQAFDVEIMHRGPTAETLQMPRISVGFQSITMTSSGNGTQPIPNAERSIYLQGRLFIPHDDEVSFSDDGDYTRYVPVLQDFKINPGSADDLVNIFKFNDTTIVGFKEHSIHVVTGVFGDMSEARRDELTSQFGLVAKKSIAQVGNDLWFLSELGVMSITQTEQNKLQGVVLPKSDPIQPLIDRINWRYGGGAVARYWDNKYYLAVPLDDAEGLRDDLLNATDIYNPGAAWTAQVVSGGTYRWVKGANEVSLVNGSQTLLNSADFVAQGSTVTLNATGGGVAMTASLRRVFKGVNNAVLVYDFLNGAWSGYDQGPGIEVSDFFVFPYNNIQRLFFYNPEGFVCLYEEDFEDQLTVPYVDVDVSAVAVGDTIRVNGGTTVTAANTSGNGATTWGVAALATANFWTDVDSLNGYSPNGLGRWTSPDTIPVKTATGARFYSTNGVLPSVTITGGRIVVTEFNARPVELTLETRGYMAEGLDLSAFQYCYVDVQTWNPKFSITAVTGGVNESVAVAAEKTKNRLKYYEPADAVDFDGTNASGNFTVPYREDYSVVPGTAGVFLGANGIQLDLHQETRETERVTFKGRAARLRVTNTQGRIRVMSALFEADIRQLRAGSEA